MFARTAASSSHTDETKYPLAQRASRWSSGTHQNDRRMGQTLGRPPAKPGAYRAELCKSLLCRRFDGDFDSHSARRWRRELIKILIADGHAVVRCGLKQIIAATVDIAVAGEAAQGFELIDKLRICHVDLVLLEMTMYGISGVDLIRRVRAEQPRLPVLVLSTCSEVHVVSRVLRAGATGFVTKNSGP